LKEDVEGRLYIGKADAFKNGFIELIKSFDRHKIGCNHDLAKAYYASEVLRERIPLSCLRFTLRFCNKPLASEASELTAYIAEFGERPPLNGVGD
jgi:hypothetical protein